MFKLNLINHFITSLLFVFIVPKIFKFCNHYIINSKKNTMFLLCYFKFFQSTFFYLCHKLDHFFIIFFFFFFPNIGSLWLKSANTWSHWDTHLHVSFISFFRKSLISISSWHVKCWKNPTFQSYTQMRVCKFQNLMDLKIKERENKGLKC